MAITSTDENHEKLNAFKGERLGAKAYILA